MSVRSLSSSSSGTPSTPVTTPSTAVTTAPNPLKTIDNWHESCTYVKQKDIRNSYGCYTFRSCQSCLESRGCMINDLGICVSEFYGMVNLETNGFQDSTSYRADMNYLNAINKNLSLPKAATANKDALTTEQNWHFRAGEATYCKADDTVCRECKANNFWRGNDTSQLSDSRFCVGENNCVCIQTCEVPSFKTPGCQWKLSQPTHYGNGEYGGYGYYTNEYVTHLAYWEWLLVLLAVVVVNLLFRCCSQSEARQLNAAKQEAVRAVRSELGIPEDEPVTAPVVRPAPVRRTVTEATDESSDHEDDAEEVKTPRHGDDAHANDSVAVFVEIQDLRPAPTRTEV